MGKNIDSGAYVAGLMNIDTSTLPADGGQRFNRLIFARSPYLLQHAENPVDWYEWGPDAFEKAQRENMPILLSIGYATCHWCHVMAHESFEDEQVATVLNRYFVCIKVDREERPDIDDFYMTVSQILTGSGGWPLNVYLTPDKRPFFAMTYLPKHSRGGMGGFLDLLANISMLWRNHPEEIDKNCNGILEAMAQLGHKPSDECAVLGELSALAMKQLTAIYDKKQGGFGNAPKFPMPINLSWLADQGAAGNGTALEMVRHTLRMMRQGGIWDQLGGGLHRYSVDRDWLVPHFEKMLYDQAMTALTALEAYQACGDIFYSDMAENIFEFVARDLTSPDGVFYSALDADSEGEEGTCYIWEKEEIDSILGNDADLYNRFFDVTEGGNFESRTILNIPVALEAFCSEEGCDPEHTARLLDDCSALLLKKRHSRIQPLRDEKIITSWNGLMIAALAKGGLICGVQKHIDSAERAASFILANMRREDGRLLRSYLNGPSDIPGFLEDYVFLCFGLIELYEATLNVSWQTQALALADDILRLFRDRESGDFVKTGTDAEQMPVRASLEHDGVIPSAFSLAAKCFIRLGHALDREELLDHAHVLLRAPLADAKKQPSAHLGALQALAMLEHEPVIIQLEGNRESPQLKSMLRIARTDLIHTVTIRFTETGEPPLAHVCAQGTCYPPVADSEALDKLLGSLKKR